jgi:hypothetical protein
MSILRLSEQFEDRESVCNYLSDLLCKGRIGLFLGAGVSKPMGLPDWPELLKKLYDAKGATQPVGEELTRQAEIFRLTYFKKDKIEYLKFIKEVLYKNADISFNSLHTHKTLVAISSLVMASRRGSVGEIVTFNWDNFIELFLAYHGFVVKSIVDSHYWATLADVIVYHPHGFIPNSGDNFSDDIIFDQKSYSQIQGDQSNPWNQRLLTIMRSKFIIFIGLSGKDNNLDSLLSCCEKDHIAKKDSPYWGITFQTNVNDQSLYIWKERGIYPMIVSDYNDDLAGFLFKICQEAAHNVL